MWIEEKMLDWTVKNSKGFEGVVSQKSFSTEKVSNNWTNIVHYKLHINEAMHQKSSTLSHMTITGPELNRMHPSHCGLRYEAQGFPLHHHSQNSIHLEMS